MTNTTRRQARVASPDIQTLRDVFTGSDLTGAAQGISEVDRRPWDLGQMSRLSMSEAALSSGPATISARDGIQVHVIFVDRGEITHQQWGRTLEVTIGEVLVYPNWIPHTIVTSGDAQLRVISLPIWWAFNEAITQAFITAERVKLSSVFLSRDALSSLVDRTFELDSSAAPPPNESLKMFGNLLRTSIDILARMQGGNDALSGRFGRILGVLHRNMDREGFKPTDAAAEIKCSVRTLHSTLAEHNTTFMQMLSEMRLKSAAYLLKTSEMRVSEVAYSCGFLSIPHFCRSFKDRFGMSAREFRKADGA